MLWLILTRHAECYKNLRDEHGGKGDVLTPRGKKQLLAITKNVKETVEAFSIPLARIFCANIIQVSETASYLSKKLGVPMVPIPTIAPLDMGLIGGLSRQKAANMDPKAAERLERWRRGELEIRELNLPGAESIDHFWHRGKEFLEEVSTNQSSAVVVSSRSTLIMLLNMMLGRNPSVPREYHAWVFANVSLAAFSHDGAWKLQRSRGVTRADGNMLRS